MAHGVDPAMKEVQTPDREAVLNRTGTDPKRQQLSPSHHAMLPGCQLSEQTVGCGQLGMTIALK
jgi:hypothetical protein